MSHEICIWVTIYVYESRSMQHNCCDEVSSFEATPCGNMMQHNKTPWQHYQNPVATRWHRHSDTHNPVATKRHAHSQHPVATRWHTRSDDTRILMTHTFSTPRGNTTTHTFWQQTAAAPATIRSIGRYSLWALFLRLWRSICNATFESSLKKRWNNCRCRTHF